MGREVGGGGGARRRAWQFDEKTEQKQIITALKR